MTLTQPVDFTLPEANIAHTPAESRGSGRSDIRLMVADRKAGAHHHDLFEHLDRHLVAGDVLVVNVSSTIPAAVAGTTADGQSVILHVASPAPGGLWSIEVRSMVPGGGTEPGPELEPQKIHLPEANGANLLARSPRNPRLWIAAIEGVEDIHEYLRAHGEPIRYLPGPRLPLSAYQTIFSVRPGSAEMPSAGRPFTHSMVTRLVSKGVAVVPVSLHAGVSSYESGEVPGEEAFEVPKATASVVNALRSTGGRVIAVGTTVVRALETVADDTGRVHAARGVTDRVVTPERGVHAVDGLLTGWHEPRSSHLALLEAFLDPAELREIYEEAIAAGYLWHEFGDELLIL
jgi:S-adenosylmethionine:tRNA ribosyltransferase-isomerase